MTLIWQSCSSSRFLQSTPNPVADRHNDGRQKSAKVVAKSSEICGAENRFARTEGELRHVANSSWSKVVEKSSSRTELHYKNKESYSEQNLYNEKSLKFLKTNFIGFVIFATSNFTNISFMMILIESKSFQLCLSLFFCIIFDQSDFF